MFIIIYKEKKDGDVWGRMGMALVFFILCGCATPEYVLYGRHLSKMPPRTCLQQAMLYADFLDGEVYTDGQHAWVVKDGRVYDSTNMAYSGYPADCWQVRQLYKGEKRDEY